MIKNNDLTPIFKALSDKNRLQILEHIYSQKLKCSLNDEGKCKDKTCIKDLSGCLKISMPTISHHVKELSNAGLIITKKKGRWSYLEINPKNFKETNKFLSSFYNQ
ncbi:winged helix-turn-helix transcriptional regulator [Candidatus Pacearchaeota archaeon]|nr:winged helix-turn-helix transcriptional regulator [Candidatus Pacearchaeota archaeon]